MVRAANLNRYRMPTRHTQRLKELVPGVSRRAKLGN
jgi:hypothetical protein